MLMTVPNIAALGELKPIEPLDLANYRDNQDLPALPKAGRFTVQAPNSFPETVFTRTKGGALSARVDPIIIGPTNEGYTLKFTSVSAKPFQRGGLNVSQMGDYLRAVGFTGKIASEADYIEAIEATANRTYQVDADWRAYAKDGYELKGMTSFPSDGNGGYLPWTNHPTEKDSEGEPIRLRANLQVVRFVPTA